MLVYSMVAFFLAATSLNIIALFLVIKSGRQKESETEPITILKPHKTHFMDYLPRANSVESELTGVETAVISAEKLREKIATGDKKVKKPAVAKPKVTPPPKKVEKNLESVKDETVEKDFIKKLFLDSASPETKKKT